MPQIADVRAGGHDASRAPAPPLGVIAFESDRDGRNRLYVANADGSGLKVLPTGMDVTGPAAWSPDGSKLAFQAAGNSLVVVARGRTERVAPSALGYSWAPDSRRLVVADDLGRLELVGLASGSRSILTRPPARRSDSGPRWSPDGRRIAFVRAGEGWCALYDVRPDGTGLRLLAEEGPRCTTLSAESWSPDGRRLAYQTHDGLYVVNANGNGRRRLVRGFFLAALWSPRGDRIAVTTNDTSGGHVFVIRPDGRGLRRVFSGGDTDDVAWSPDGRLLAARPSGDPFGRSDIFIVDLANLRTRRVTQSWRYGYRIQLEQWHPHAHTTDDLSGQAVAWAIPSDSVATATTLSTRYPVTQLVADGALAAVVTSAPHQCLELWQPGQRPIVRFASGPTGACGLTTVGYPVGAERHPFWDLALGGGRVAFPIFSHAAGTNMRGMVVGSRDRPKLQSIGGLCADVIAAPMCVRPPLGHLTADGSLFVFDTWQGPDFWCATPCPPPKRNGGLWRIDGVHAVQIASSTGALTPLSVDAGRILIDHEDGTLEIRTPDGAVVRSFSFESAALRGARLQGADLVALTTTGVEVIDAGSGDLRRSWPPPADDLTLADVQNGIAVFAAGADLHLLRLDDGSTTTIHTHSAAPVIAQLEPAGLFYAATSTDTDRPGRIVFLPMRLLGKS